MRESFTFLMTYLIWAVLALIVSCVAGGIALTTYAAVMAMAERIIGLDAHNVSGAAAIMAFLLCCLGVWMGLLTVRSEMVERRKTVAQSLRKPKPGEREPLPGSTRPLN